MPSRLLDHQQKQRSVLDLVLIRSRLDDDREGWKRQVRQRLSAHRFTRRQREISWLLLEGKENAVIADELYIAVETVKNHLTIMYEKTGTRDRLQLALRLLGVF